MSEYFPADDSGTEARARRDEIEGLVEKGVKTEAIMSAKTPRGLEYRRVHLGTIHLEIGKQAASASVEEDSKGGDE